MKSLVLAEKPSVARDLAGTLGSFTRKDGYLENDKYVVSWAIGHLVGLASPEDYNPILKKWSFDTLPIIPDKYTLKALPGTIKQFKILKTLLSRPDIDLLINSCDAGREGELIFRYIYALSGSKKPFKRLWLSETTPEAVNKAFTSLRPGKDLDRLALAAEARSRADWLIGINATRAFTVKHNDLLSVGRVQTPTLALIVNRENEIRNFIPVPYWELNALFKKEDGQTYTGKWFKGGLDRFHTQDAARQVEDRVKGEPGVVEKVEQKDISEPPPLLYNLNDLQKDANKKYGLSAARTLEVAQSLYETKKLITYPRTDSRHLTKDLAGTIPKRLSALSGLSDYAPFVAEAKAAGSPGKRYVNDSKVTDHPALIPTDTRANINALSTEERKIYDLVVRRFLAIFFPAALYKQTQVVTSAGGETFITTGRVELNPGWKKVYAPPEGGDPGQKTKQVEAGPDPEDGEDTPENIPLPQLLRGEKVMVKETKVMEKQTKHPKRFTEATLLATMEGVGKLLDDKELKDAMKGHGLGTPATRAAIIERLIKVSYIERKQKSLVPTPKGEKLISMVPDIIKSPDMTANWEKTLSDIESGQADPKVFMAGITDLTRQTVELARAQESSAPARNGVKGGKEPLGQCPLCGRDVVDFPKSYGCTGYREGCKFAIWKEIAGKKITPTQAGTLLKKGKTGILKGFKSKEKKPFEAALALSKEGKVTFQFETRGI